MSKNTQNKYANNLKKIAYNQTETFDRNHRSEIVSEINRMNAERNGYEFTYSIGKKGLRVTRVVPNNFFNRKLYISSIGKSELTSALRANNWSKEGVAREFGISARSIGRMIERYNIDAKPYNSANRTASKSTSKSSAKANNKRPR